ncbi:MAG: L-lysine 6-transaminase [Nitriliruptorales bacterium]|nr:L-lysine 6-transaminase [Nitriliruptorales bacterium]
MQPQDVLSTMARHMIVDGFDFVLDHERSQGSVLVDLRDGTEYLDMFSFFASNALGMNHPALLKDEVSQHLARIAINKPSNSDVYSAEIAGFVKVFARVLGDPRLDHLFLIEGGALAVENALKAAFDWKSQKNEQAGRDPSLGTQVLHLTGAFHGRTGYTMSLTNTEPKKVARYPKFDWPRIDAPYLSFPLDENAEANRRREEHALKQVRQALEADGHDIACFIAEPIQSEGGDRHISPRFLREVQELCHEHDVLFALDEVQTGVGLTGTHWCYEQLDLEPDLVAFGKKTHVCGVMAGGRINEIEDNVFVTPSRLNSTFGGNLVDITRMTYVLEIIEQEDLVSRAAELGDHLIARLHDLAARHDAMNNVRGRGLMCAFDLRDGDTRDRVLRSIFEDEQVFLIGCGPASVRFRPPLTVTEAELDSAADALDRVLDRVT